jgi:hypothetical protein
MPIHRLALIVGAPPDIAGIAATFASATALSIHGLLIQNPAQTGSVLRHSSTVIPKTTGVTSHRRQYANGAAFCFDRRFTVTPRATRRLIHTTATASHKIAPSRNRPRGSPNSRIIVRRS